MYLCWCILTKSCPCSKSMPRKYDNCSMSFILKLSLNTCFVSPNRFSFDAPTMTSSTQKRITIISLSTYLVYRQLSLGDCSNSLRVRNECNILFQFLPDFFNPYNDLFNLQNNCSPFSVLASKPSGCSRYISQSMGALRYAVLNPFGAA